VALDAKLLRRVQDELAPSGGAVRKSSRLVDDASRLLRRIDRLVEQRVVAAPVDRDALELACYALQLPLAPSSGALSAGRLGLVALKDRAEQAAELLVGLLGGADDSLLDRATRILQESPQKTPVLDEAKLLADVVGLDDYGQLGLIRSAIQIGLSGGGAEQVRDAAVKREQYGYFEARLKDGFHFDATRAIARKRLDNARAATKLLVEEIDDL
jgi:hypothetical protein